MTATLVETPEPFFECFSLRTLSASVCTNLTDEQAVDQMNSAYPLQSATVRWTIARSDVSFPSGKRNPHECDHATSSAYPGRRHVLMVF